MIDWNICKDIFERDTGSLRDIYIFPTSIADWQAIYPFLCGFSDVAYVVDGPRPLPNDVEQIFKSSRLEANLLRIKIGRMNIHFHFFIENEIECDIDPREISSQADLDQLLTFMQRMGDLVHKRVVLTPENCPEDPLISYDPQTQDFCRHNIA